MSALERWLERSRAMGFLGPGPVTQHVEHSMAFAAAFGARRPESVLDLGSGGGVPGLVLALEWPDVAMTLLEASERRSAFLVEAIDGLELTERVAVLRGRAEDVGRDPTLRGTFDAVVARSFGPPAVTAECAAPFLRRGGRVVVSEPPVAASQRWPATGLDLLGLVPEAVAVDGGPRFQVLRQEQVCPERYPRRAGIPAKRPLWRASR